MSETTLKAVDTWGLHEILAMLCQVTRDAGAAERAPETEGSLFIANDLPLPSSLSDLTPRQAAKKMTGGA